METHASAYRGSFRPITTCPRILNTNPRISASPTPKSSASTTEAENAATKEDILVALAYLKRLQEVAQAIEFHDEVECFAVKAKQALNLTLTENILAHMWSSPWPGHQPKSPCRRALASFFPLFELRLLPPLLPILGSLQNCVGPISIIVLK